MCVIGSRRIIFYVELSESSIKIDRFLREPFHFLHREPQLRRDVRIEDELQRTILSRAVGRSDVASERDTHRLTFVKHDRAARWRAERVSAVGELL